MARVLLILMFGITSISNSLGQQVDVERKWTDITGKFSLTASLQELNSGYASLRKTDGNVIKIPRTRLSEADRGFLDAVDTLQQTSKQAVLLQSHMSRVATHPAATVEIINALRSEYPAAIGAHMIGSCVNAVVDYGPSSLARSRRCADDAIKTLSAVEEHFPGLHRKTLASVLNNRAVLSIRQGNIMGAANYLNQAANLLPDEIPFAVYHNASMLLNSEVELGNSRTKLAITVAKGRPQSAEQVPGYLMYTLVHDSFLRDGSPEAAEPTSASQPAASQPAASQPAAPQPAAPAPAAPAPGKFLTGYGSGFLIAPSLVLTNRHVAEDSSAFRVRNDSGLSVSAKVEKVSTSSEIDLAILRLEKPLPLQPFSMRQDVPSIGESFIVLGYPIPEVFEASITASRGIVSKLVSENLHILHDATTDPGNSGGPCVDARGNVIGVHFAGSAVSDNNRNYAVSPTAIKMFLSGVTDYVAQPPQAQDLDFAAVVAQRKDSVFMIECYSDEMPRTQTRSSPVVQQSVSAMQKYALIPDHTCLVCSGKGLVDCPACANGFVTTKKNAKLAVTVTGEVIYGPKSFKTRCSGCNRGNRPCPNCRGTGKLK